MSDDRVGLDFRDLNRGANTARRKLDETMRARVRLFTEAELAAFAAERGCRVSPNPIVTMPEALPPPRHWRSRLRHGR